nr:MAG TPA: hypothetical protein [Caudoviricetes sp.]
MDGRREELISSGYYLMPIISLSLGLCATR